MPKLEVIPCMLNQYQDEIMKGMTRFSVAVCHRRMGKTVLAIIKLIMAAVDCQRSLPRYAYVAPTMKQAREAAWDYLKQYTRVIPGRKVNETRACVDLPNGARITLYGAENADALRGIYLDGLVMDEVAWMRDTVWDMIFRPFLMDREGWAFFIGTPMGKNMFYDLYQNSFDKEENPDWSSFMYKVNQTNVLKPEEIDKYKKNSSPDAFAQEFMCSFEASIKGAYYANILTDIEKKGQLGSYPWLPNYQVHTAWDLGFKDDTSIWFYQKPPGGYPRIIDYYESRQKAIPEYIKVLLDKGKQYLYGQHYAPHDVKRHELGSGKTIKEIALNLGLRFQDVRRIPVQDGIDNARMFLQRCYFNTDNKAVDKAVEKLRAYRTEYDEKKSVFGKRPRHDRSCLTGDTKIRTLSGWYPIKELVGKDFYIWSYNFDQHRLIPAKANKCWKTKTVNKIINITLDNESEIKCTPDHLFLRRDEQYIEAQQLTIGDSLMPFYETFSKDYTKVHLNDGTLAVEHMYVYSVFNGFTDDGHHIHHIDSNKLNNNPENLQKLTIHDHISLHSAKMGWKYKHKDNCRLVINHKVINIEVIEETHDVYDISVPEYHNFVAEGVVLHNSHASDAFRYLAVSYEEEDPSLLGGSVQQRNNVLNYKRKKLQGVSRTKKRKTNHVVGSSQYKGNMELDKEGLWK